MLKLMDESNLQVQPCDFVIFEYQGELFPGKVTGVQKDGRQIQAMAKSGVNWKWPKVKDDMFYRLENIKQRIGPPVEGKRGAYVIPELANHLAVSKCVFEQIALFIVSTVRFLHVYCCILVVPFESLQLLNSNSHCL